MPREFEGGNGTQTEKDASVTDERSAAAVEDLIDEAWEADSPTRRAAFARKALARDPDAIDAYVALALCVETTAERIALLREAVRIGERVWARELKRPRQSHFWSDIDTRPFMRAMHNLALALWERGARDEAAALAERLLRLNPNDNQGVRFLALAWHPVLGNWEKVEKILKRYDGDIRTEYLYARCLDAIRRGDDAEALLADAIETNPHVPALLLNGRGVAEWSGGSVAFGSEEEAAAYAAYNRPAWEADPHALDWLRRATKEGGKKRT